MIKKLEPRLKIMKERLLLVLDCLYDRGLVIKETIDFTVKSSLYLYGISWGLLLSWFVLTNKIEKSQILPGIVQVQQDSEPLILFATFIALLLVLTIVTPFFPNAVRSKRGRACLFIVLLGFFLYLFLMTIRAIY